jgi:hypothetical protein
MSVTELFICSLLIGLILMLLLIFLQYKRIIGFRTLRWGAVFAIAQTVIPGSMGVTWPFAFGMTILCCVWVYWFFKAYEKLQTKKEQSEN